MLSIKKNRVFLFYLFFFSISITTTQAQTYDIYFSGNVGIALLQDATTTYPADILDQPIDFSFKEGFTISGALGTARGNYRLEAEISYQKNTLDNFEYLGVTFDPDDLNFSGNGSALTGLLNAYLDFNAVRSIKPYITAGVGFSNLDFEGRSQGEDELTTNDKDTVLAYQIGAGLGYPISEKVVIDFRYRLYGTQDPDFDGVKSEILSHNFLVGLRVHF